MCLLVVQKPNVKMKNKHIENAWMRNSDGGGYSFAVNSKIVTRKYMDLNDFKTNFNNDWNGNKSSSFLIHFRYATHGLTNIDNVHPFKVNNNLVFGHNGVINCVDDDCKLSDTQMFNNTILKKLKSNFLNSKPIRLLISESIHNSKLAFLDNFGNYTIINSDLGHWNKSKSIWFSNDGYKKPSYINVYGGNYNKYNNAWSFDNHQNNKNECEWCSGTCEKSYDYYGSKLCEPCYEDNKKYII